MSSFLNQIRKWMRIQFQMQGGYKRIRTPPSAARRVSYYPCRCDPKVWRSKQATPAPGASSPHTTKNSSLCWDLKPLGVIHGCHVGLYLRSNIIEGKSASGANTLDHSLTRSPPHTRLVSGSISSPCSSGFSYVTWRQMELTLHRVVWQRHTAHPASRVVPIFPRPSEVMGNQLCQWAVNWGGYGSSETKYLKRRPFWTLHIRSVAWQGNQISHTHIMLIKININNN